MRFAIIVPMLAVNISSVAQIAQGPTDAKIVPPPKETVPLLQRLLGPNGQAMIPIAAEDVPAIAIATKRLESPTCSTAIGGIQFRAYAQGRLLTAHYYKLPSTMVNAEQTDGRFATVYAMTNVGDQTITFFPSFFSPESVLTRMLPGNEEHLVNSLPTFTAVHGLKDMSPDILKAVIILHEHTHRNRTGGNDLWCVAYSMILTRWVAEKCFPEIIDRAADPNLIVLKGVPYRTKSCDGCHAALGTKVNLPVEARAITVDTKAH